MTALLLLLVAAFVLAIVGIFVDHRATAVAVLLVVVYLALHSR
jgi:hypothetical protein